MSAAFSAIMIVGAFVLPDTNVGITEASTTSQAFKPAHAKLGVDDRHFVHAHFAGAHGVIDRVGAGADVLLPILIGLGGIGAEQFFVPVLGQSWRVEDIPSHSRAFDHGLQIAFV